MCCAYLVEGGFERVEMLRVSTVEDLVACGVKRGHARLMLAEVSVCLFYVRSCVWCRVSACVLMGRWAGSGRARRTNAERGRETNITGFRAARV